MRLRLRLRQQGNKNRRCYRIVIMDSRAPRDGKYVESIGNYNPLSNKDTVVIKEDRAKHWIGLGAQPSETVTSLLKKHCPKALEKGK